MTPLIQQRLLGKRALVTGAASGIGRAVAIRFAQEGALVAINYVGASDAAEETLELVRHASPVSVSDRSAHRTFKADVADEPAARAMIDEVVAEFGRLDILVNNAGIQLEAASELQRIEDVRRVFDVNLIGAVICSQAAIRHFLSRPGGGVIVNCSSVHEIVPKPAFLGYSISKGGLGNMTRTLALEYADRGIRVNAVGPGAIVTPINKAWIDDPELRMAVESHIPMGRAGTADEIAAVFAFLASDDASYITGQTIFACGGLTLFGDFKKNWSS